MKLDKSVVTSIRTSGSFSTDDLVGHANEMNERMEKNIQNNEEKIVLGLKCVQGMRVK